MEPPDDDTQNRVCALKVKDLQRVNPARRLKSENEIINVIINNEQITELQLKMVINNKSLENQPVTVGVHQSEVGVVSSSVRRCILNAAGWTRDPAALTGLQLSLLKCHCPSAVITHSLLKM